MSIIQSYTIWYPRYNLSKMYTTRWANLQIPCLCYHNLLNNQIYESVTEGKQNL